MLAADDALPHHSVALLMGTAQAHPDAVFVCGEIEFHQGERNGTGAISMPKDRPSCRRANWRNNSARC